MASGITDSHHQEDTKQRFESGPLLRELTVVGKKRGKMCQRVTIGFGLTSNWLRKSGARV